MTTDIKKISDWECLDSKLEEFSIVTYHTALTSSAVNDYRHRHSGEFARAGTEHGEFGGDCLVVTPIDPVQTPATGVKILDRLF